MNHMYQLSKDAKLFLALVAGTFLLVSCGSGDNTPATSSPVEPAAAGTTVQVSVTAQDPDGDQLHYRWAANEGTITNVDAPTTTWVIPQGSGLQFAYVVVSDNKGGYTESRAAALTFDQTPLTVATPATIPTSSTIGNSGFAWGSVFYKPSSFGRNVYLPGVTIRLSLNGTPVGSTITDMKGQFFISNLPNETYTITYQIPGRSQAAFKNFPSIQVDNTNLPTSPRSVRYVLGEIDLPTTVNVAGSVRLADQTYCGIRDEFFTHSSLPNLFREPMSGTAQLLSVSNSTLSSPFPVNHYGDFLIPASSVTSGTQAKVRISCEKAPVQDSATITLPSLGPVKLPAVMSLSNRRPIVGTMKVLLNGQDFGRPDVPKPRTLFRSVNNTPPIFGDDTLIAEIIHTPGDDAFLTYKGIDTRKSACVYYRAIGAVEGCDANGFPTGAQLTLAQWKSQFNLSPFSNGNPANPVASDGQEVRINFINKNDLNFGRDMQGVKLTNGDVVAYNVCNYPGPQDVTDSLGSPKEIGTETQDDIDLAVENIRRGIGMIVCVAMDNSAIPGINGGQPFTKFYTFGPTGRLLLSVSLDGRREKFMPGSCTACHGGDSYGGRFPDDESGSPDMKSRWLPFDMANLVFSSKQDAGGNNAAIKILNQRLIGPNLDALTTPRAKELINGWYAGGSMVQQDFIPSLYTGRADVYHQVIQGNCQTCHAAQRGVNENTSDIQKNCGGSTVLEQNHVMANALVPFERTWLDATLPPLLSCGTTPSRHPAL